MVQSEAEQVQAGREDSLGRHIHTAHRWPLWAYLSVAVWWGCDLGVVLHRLSVHIELCTVYCRNPATEGKPLSASSNPNTFISSQPVAAMYRFKVSAYNSQFDGSNVPAKRQRI